MIKSINNLPIIETPKGFGELEKIYISELGYLMFRIYNMDGTFTTYNMGKHEISDNIFSKALLENEQIGSSWDKTL